MSQGGVPASAGQASTYIALSLASLVIGYYLGTGRALLGYSREVRKRSLDSDEDSEGEVDDEDLRDIIDRNDKDEMALLASASRLGKSSLSSLLSAEECKLVLVVRTDLKMDKGKIAAQCAHATLACYKASLVQKPDIIKRWERLGGQAKVALKCPSEAELLGLEKKAKAAGLIAKTIQDAGRTQIAAGSRTVLGIGPAPVSEVDKITGHLKLL